MLDRSTVAAGERSEVSSRRRGLVGRQRNILLAVAGGVAAVVVYLSNSQLRWNVFPESEFGTTLADRVNEWVANFVETFGDFTTWISNTVTEWFLNPLDDLLANSPWWLVAALIITVAATLGGWSKEGLERQAPGRVVAGCAVSVVAVLLAGFWAGNTPDVSWVLWWGAVVVLLVLGSVLGAGGALYPTTICLVLLFGVGLWQDSMVTLAMTLVATVMVMVFGVIIGVWMGRSRRVDAAIRPVLDALQTMPPLVYLVPALALFPVGRFLAIVAAVLYAAPVAIKITADGIRGVAATTVEAAHSLGSSRWQMIGKVQVPMSKGSIVLAANQGLLFVLSMVVIGGLVGGGALGFLVINGFSQREDFGKGLAAGIAITALGIMLDRITVHTAARYGRAEN
jgi:glycine betaine/proline transport system permease protein